MKFKSFTLVEMLVTLTIFSMSMIVIYNLTASTLRMMENMSGGDASRTAAILMLKVLDNTLRDSYSIYSETNGVFMVESFDNSRSVISVKDKTVTISEIRQDKVLPQKMFKLETVEDIQFKIREAAQRKALDVTIVFKAQTLNKMILLGYKKQEG